MVGILALALVAQTAPTAQVAAHPAKLGLRAWLADTVLPVGAPARVYVQLDDSGYLALLHVEPSGRIRVLYPAHPTDPDYVPGGVPFVVEGVTDSTTFRVAAPGTGTLLAVRSWTPLRFDDLADGNRWDYARALLLQPTAGNPFAALLDIADRMANGDAYTYDLTGYRTPGALAARRTTTDSVCGSCFTAHRRYADPAATDDATAAIAIDHSLAASGNGSVVDCSYATLADSFCGVDNSVTTYQESTMTAPPAATTTYVYPYYPVDYFPLFFFRRHRTPPPPPLPPPAIALNLRAAPRSTAPPPRRRMPRIVVTQPSAPSHPVVADAPAAAAQGENVSAPTAAMGRRFALTRPAGIGARVAATGPASGWATSPGRPATAMSAPAPTAPGARVSGAVAAAAPSRVVVPSHAAVVRARGH